MRVLHVDTAREWRGGQTQLQHLARGTRDACAVMLPPEAALVPALRRDGVEVFAERVTPAALRRRARGFDLVACHTSPAHLRALLAGLRPVVHRRVDFAPHWSSRPKYRLALGYVAVSNAVARVLASAGVPRERVVAVHDGVDPTPFLQQRPDRAGVRAALGLPAETPLVVAVGALVPHKGHRDLVAALQALPGVHLALLGEGPLRNALSGPRVHVLGQVPDVPRWLASADVACHPSREEGLGQAVIEAGIAGIPLVATTAGGIPECAPPSARLVPPADPAALVAALRATLADPHARARSAADAQAIAARFSIPRLVAGTLDAWARLARAAEGAP